MQFRLCKITVAPLGVNEVSLKIYSDNAFL